MFNLKTVIATTKRITLAQSVHPASDVFDSVYTKDNRPLSCNRGSIVFIRRLIVGTDHCAAKRPVLAETEV